MQPAQKHDSGGTGSIDSLLASMLPERSPSPLPLFFTFPPFPRTGATFLPSCPVYQRFSKINFLGLFKIHIYIVLNGFSDHSLSFLESPGLSLSQGSGRGNLNFKGRGQSPLLQSPLPFPNPSPGSQVQRLKVGSLGSGEVRKSVALMSPSPIDTPFSVLKSVGDRLGG